MNLGSSLLDIGYSIALSRFRLVPRRERGAPYPHNPEKRAAQRRGYTASIFRLLPPWRAAGPGRRMRAKARRTAARLQQSPSAPQRLCGRKRIGVPASGFSGRMRVRPPVETLPPLL